MKKQMLGFVFLFSGLTALNTASAQIKVNVNLGAQPTWGPVGYDRVDYYYLPDHDVYYNVPRKEFVYYKGKEWFFAPTLPASYGNVNLYNTYKVVVNESRPYLRNDVYKVKYAKYKGWKGERQLIIRDSKDERYFKGDPNHPGNNGKHLGQYKNGNNGNNGKNKGNKGKDKD